MKKGIGKGKNRVPEIAILYEGSKYTIQVEGLQKLLKEIPDLANLKYYEGVVIKEDTIEIQEHDLYDIDLDILLELGIQESNYGVRIDKEGIIAVNQVKFYPQMMKNATSAAQYKHIGNFVRIEGSYYLLPEDQAQLIRDAFQFNQDEERTRNVREQYKIVRRVKDGMHSDTIQQDPAYDEYNPIIIDDIELGMLYLSEDELEIYPQLTDEAAPYTGQLKHRLDSQKDVPDKYHIEIDGKTVDLILTEGSKETVKKIKQVRGKGTVKGKEAIQQLLINIDNPNSEHFIPNLKYSRRVLGWGPLRFPSMQKDPSGLIWIEEIDENGETYISIPIQTPSGDVINITEEDIKKIGTAIKEAEKKGSETIEIEKDGKKYRFPKAIGERIVDYIDEHDPAGDLTVEPPAKSSSNRSSANHVIIESDFENLNYVEEVIPIGASEFESPAFLMGQERWDLFNYQQQGVAWLQDLYRAYLDAREGQINPDPTGGLLADDMGLGKTLQVLTFLVWLREREQLDHALLIMPKTLIQNWTAEANWASEAKGEIERFFSGSDLKPVAFLDSQSVKYRLGWLSLSKYIKSTKSNIVVTSYETITKFCKTQADFNKTFGTIDWDVIVCDEAQKIKNPKTKRTISVKSLKAKLKIACTATPIENYMDELWSICDWVLPGRLGSLAAFRKKYVHRINRDNVEIHNEIAEALKGHFIRRTKRGVLAGKLPEKEIIVTKIPASIEQKNAFKIIQKNENQSKHIIGFIGKLIGIMSHPYFGLKGEEFANPDQTMLLSPKFRWLKKTLREIEKKGEKAIIFTPSKWIQRAVQQFIIETTMAFDVPIVNGETKIGDRLRDIEEAQQRPGFGAMILSPEVAGFGLTITAFNHVIHFSRGWNPAKENQATDRVYRIGQNKPVTVYIPVVTWQEEGSKKYASNEEYYEDSNMPKRPTPEENLDILMRKKGKMLKLFFSVAGSIKPDDLVGGIMGSDSIGDAETNLFSLINQCDGYEFEALAALVFEEMGYKTILTPAMGDLGIDLIVEEEGKPPLLIQVTKTKNLKELKLKDLAWGKSNYEEKLGCECDIGIFFNSDFPKRYKKWEKVNKLRVFDWRFLQERSRSAQFTYADIQARNRKRINLFS